MNNSKRTLVYVVAAVVMAALAIWKGMPAPEINPSQFSDTGKEYYPDFVSPNEATGIRVVVYDEKASDIKPFEVQFKNGLWRIPSHYEYPADGEEQLAKTAASLVGVKRGAVAGESELDIKRLGVIDPLTDDDSLKEFSGDRLTLKKGETVLVDLIVGKAVPDRNGFYYVRKPDEKLTYIAELDIDLSTKFSDWIEPDLLKLDQNKLRRVNVRDYSVDEQKGSILISDYFDLSRADQSGPWGMEIFDPKTNQSKEKISELKTSEVNSIVNALGDLKIAGVRPKPSFISSDLKLNGDVTPSRESSMFLSQLGFFFAPNQDQKTFEIYSNQGDMTAVTEEGVAYTLRFGAVFTGDEFDIEVGSASPEEGEKKPETSDENAEKEPGEEQTPEGMTKNRYLFVSVQFDQNALGDAPVKPTPPAEKKPEEKKPAPTVEKKSDKPAEENTDKKPEATDAKAETPKTEEKPAETVDPQKVYEAALAKYETDIVAYQKKIEDGKKQVEKLNQRFADWYYVIDAASFDQLNKSRVDLVEVKESAPAQPTEPGSKEATPKKTPESTKKPMPKKPVSPKPADEKPKTPAPKAKEADKKSKAKKTEATEKPAPKPTPKEPKPGEPKPKEAPKTEKKPAS